MAKSQFRTTAKKFQEDLEKGLQGENQVVTFLEKLGLTFIGDSKSLYPEHYKFFDLVFLNKEKKQIKVEVKTDTYITQNRDTGNLVIEVSCNKKPSGITTTLSDIFLYSFPNLSKDNVWMIKTKDLKKLIKDNTQLCVVSGGDGNTSRLILIPRHEFQQYFKVYSYSFTGLGKPTQTTTTSNGFVIYHSDKPTHLRHTGF